MYTMFEVKTTKMISSDISHVLWGFCSTLEVLTTIKHDMYSMLEVSNDGDDFVSHFSYVLAVLLHFGSFDHHRTV
jgi:hypothetical protein